MEGGVISLWLSRPRPQVGVGVTEVVTNTTASTAVEGGIFWGMGATGPPTAPKPRALPRSPSLSVSSESGDSRSELKLPVPALSSRSADTRAREPDRRDREKLKRRRHRLL